ncbi:MAG: hypothetical protein HYT80_09630 [Euryarchaeota archaeon]|nr:hypothetical protein [Euryarchaeota archaeon]
MELFVRPCQSGRSMEALPSPPLRLDLIALEERLEASGWQPVVNAGVMLIVRKDHEATIYENGKVVLKSRDDAMMRRVWDELAPHLEATGGGSVARALGPG